MITLTSGWMHSITANLASSAGPCSHFRLADS